MFNRYKFIIILSLAILSPSSNYAHAYKANFNKTQQASSSESQTSDIQQNKLADKIELIRLYSIIDGKLEHLIYRKADLRKLSELKVDGYVCGIVVLCEEDMNISMSGQQLNKIRMNPDGTYSLKYFGTFRPEDLELPRPDQSYYEKLQVDHPDDIEELFLTGGYSLFPRVIGNTIMKEDRINLNFMAAGRQHTLSICQEEPLEIKTVSLDAGRKSDDLDFVYVGNNFERMKENCNQFEAKLIKIAEGVDYVESTFGIDLVQKIFIIDYEGVYNAISCDGENDIWFYVRILNEEPLDELKTIAAHEALHVLVDKAELAMNPAIREYFANLKGYSEFSYERFILVVTGNAITDESESNNNIFFNFINEKNFLEDMKGGHSQKNIEEFCTSFLHSIIFMDRLAQNLHKALKIAGTPRGIRYLTSSEKKMVLDQYILGIECIMGALGRSSDRISPSHKEMDLLLRTGLKKARNIRSKLT